ncbi:MAG: acyl-CoA thioesterase [Bacteroidota bacterium]
MIKPLEIQIRFSDIDLMGHVNNAVYLNYFESARMHYLVSLLGADWDWRKNGIILKTNEIEYISPVFLTDKPSVSVFLDAIGTKSFTLAYELTVNGIIKTKGKSVLVSFDVYTSKPVELNDLFKLALTKLTKTT